MQDYTRYVNPARMQFLDEYEKLLIAEIERTEIGMQEAMQYFADMRDRNTAAQKQLGKLRFERPTNVGRCE